MTIRIFYLTLNQDINEIDYIQENKRIMRKKVIMGITDLLKFILRFKLIHFFKQHRGRETITPVGENIRNLIFKNNIYIFYSFFA